MYPTYNTLIIIGGAFWSLTYILIIRRGIIDRTFGMPLVALCANISWEGVFSFIVPQSLTQLYINYAWFILDLFIVFQFLRYGKSEFNNISNKMFYAVFLLALVTAFGLILSITYEFKDWQGSYAAFGQNLIMSVLFIAMLFSRGNLRGQSIYIALFKMFGTGIFSLAFYIYQPIAQGVLLPFLFVSIFVYDILYIGLVYRKYREYNISIWKRF
jgi:hypothetical protein